MVGIGASAGGIEALQALFRGVPADTGIGYVIVTHLSPDHASVLHEIVARHTAMPVLVARDGMAVAPDHIYVMPERAVLGITAGRLSLAVPRAPERRPIDIFLTALAQDLGEYAGAIILSGGDADGTLGVKAVKERGGLTMAQVADGHPPRHPQMPDSALSSGLVDFALPAGEMGAKLLEFRLGFRQLDQLAAALSGGPPQGADAAEAAARDEIYQLLRAQMGHDFSGYKARTFLRRVQRRMQVHRLDSLQSYVALLRRDPPEVALLFRDLLINVTSFFRDADAFTALREQVVPQLFQGRGAEDTVRVWVPGCATGEEVFSIAILLREHMDTLRNVPRVQLFATDIDERALAVARSACYPAPLLETIPEPLRRRFFVQNGASFVVSKDIRDMCVFSPHSVLRDPPFSRIDLVSCRNLLIYFGPDAQARVIPTFRYALRPGGYLFLGTSENVTQFDALFTPVDKKQRLFRVREDGGPVPRLPMFSSGLRNAVDVAVPPPRSRPPAAQPLRQAVESHVLERHAPPHVVVNADGDIVFFSARTGKYFEAPPGAPNRQLLPMARRGLRLDLRGAFRAAVETGRPAHCAGVLFENEDGRLQPLSLTVEPLPAATEERLYLVTFLDSGPPLGAGETHPPPQAGPDTVLLERELRDTRERLQSVIEEYETALEELKSANEELVSVNEEMQSTNEEMEASKEELQSLNEELHTVNGELAGKVEALDLANADLHNLFEVTDVATIFLDRQLRIRLFTPAASGVFSIIAGDRGRPLTDLASRLPLPALAEDLAEVLQSGRAVERQFGMPAAGGVGAAKGRPEQHYLVRITPYRDGQATPTGIALTVIDVTSLAQAEAQHRVLIAELNHRVKNMLAIVLAIAWMTRVGSTTLEAFYTVFTGRLEATTRAYELLSRRSWRPVPLADMALRELEPFGLERIAMQGDAVALDARQALSIGMVLHELATNAVKYGALSAAAGGIRLDWRREARPDGRAGILLTWQEQRGPPVRAPEQTGFGMELIRNEASYNLGGGAELDFRPEGLHATIRFPEAADDAP